MGTTPRPVQHTEQLLPTAAEQRYSLWSPTSRHTDELLSSPSLHVGRDTLVCCVCVCRSWNSSGSRSASVVTLLKCVWVDWYQICSAQSPLSLPLSAGLTVNPSLFFSFKTHNCSSSYLSLGCHQFWVFFFFFKVFPFYRQTAARKQKLEFPTDCHFRKYDAGLHANTKGNVITETWFYKGYFLHSNEGNKSVKCCSDWFLRTRILGKWCNLLCVLMYFFLTGKKKKNRLWIWVTSCSQEKVWTVQQLSTYVIYDITYHISHMWYMIWYVLYENGVLLSWFMTTNVFKCARKVFQVTFSPSLNYRTSVHTSPSIVSPESTGTLLSIKNSKRWHTQAKMSGHHQGPWKEEASSPPRGHLAAGIWQLWPQRLSPSSLPSSPFLPPSCTFIPPFSPSDTGGKTPGLILEAEQHWSGPGRGHCLRGSSHSALVCRCGGIARTPFYNRCDSKKTEWTQQTSTLRHAVTVPSRTVLSQHHPDCFTTLS